MKLQSQLILVLCLVIGLYVAADYAIQRCVVFPYFVSLEEEEARKDMQRCRDAITKEIEHLDLFTHDWASWDDIYDYAVDHNKEFEEENFFEEVYEDARLNLVYVVDQTGHIIFHSIRDSDYTTSLQLEEFPESQFPDGNALVRLPKVETVVRGLLLTEKGPLMISSRPILKSGNLGPIRGALIMGRFLDTKAVGELVEQTSVDFRARDVNSLSANLQSALQQTSKEASIAVHTSQDDSLSVFSSLRDLSGKPILLLEATVPRHISTRGTAALRFAVASLVVAGITMGTVLLLVLRRIVIHPISELTEHAMAIGKSGDLTTRFGLRRSDEIGTLAVEFDGMVENLADSRKKLATLSREAGMADVASGVLHNVGNVLTNANVVVGDLKSRIDQLGYDGLNKAVALMNEHSEDLGDFLVKDERGKKLPLYLSRLADQSTEASKALRSDIETLAESLEHINHIIDAQQQYATGTQADEPTSLEAMLVDALDMFSPSFEKHGITVEREFDVLPSVLVDRGKLAQVVVNIFTNAKDALKDSPDDDRRMTVRLSRSDEDRIRIEISDHGVGITKKDAAKVFSNGYTTKGRGHGHGLHYCALAVNELKGAISVKSPGPGEGATFTIDLPMRRVKEGHLV